MSTFGPSFDKQLDGERIRHQHEGIRDFMLRSGWRTLREISLALGYPEASVSAQLRHARKAKFGSYRVNKRRRGNGGTYEYQMLPPAIPQAFQPILDGMKKFYTEKRRFNHDEYL